MVFAHTTVRVSIGITVVLKGPAAGCERFPNAVCRATIRKGPANRSDSALPIGASTVFAPFSLVAEYFESRCFFL